ncbi:hypothetical protein TRVA0_008S02388 [Trichomonascus vanleenenianus]|uniref:uncharacterized protein n=1 Tax=Trichomonascus vanleenenianus TaxID=2268995 RepID=UPI003ECA23CC
MKSFAVLIALVLVDYAVAITTIIDILSASAQYSVLLSHIQRHGLVPVINESRNTTLIAPVNSAFANVDPSDITKEVLLYHLVNATVLFGDMSPGETRLVDSYLYHESELRSVKAFSAPLKVARNSKETVNDVEVVESDLRASRDRGAVQAVDSLLTVPSSLRETLASIPGTSIFQSLVETENLFFESPTTLFVPTDEAFRDFSDVELKYLSHARAHDDRMRLLNRHISKGLVGFHRNKIVHALDGVALELCDFNTTVNGTFVPASPSHIAFNGIIHTYNSLLTSEPAELVEYSPEKYLYGLDAESFVLELAFKGLKHLVDGSETDPQTIFVPLTSVGPVDAITEEVEASEMHRGTTKEVEVSQMPRETAKEVEVSETPRRTTKEAEASEEPRRMTVSQDAILYHFVQGQYHLLERINDEFLLTSKMTTKKMKHTPQRIKVVSNASGTFYVNGHQVVSREYTVANTSIYFVDSELEIPPSLSLAVGPFFQNSYSISFLEKLNLLYPPSGVVWTVLLPTKDAWKELGLVTDYLRSNTTMLRQVFDSMIFNGAFYSDSEPRDATLLSNDTVRVSYSRGKKKKRDFDYERHKFGGVLTVGDIAYDVNVPDILFNSGVAHSIDSITLPDEISIAPEELIAAGDRESFVDLLVERNMSYVLDPQNSYTILVPSMDALERDGINSSSPDIDLLLQMHVLPGNPISNLFQEQEIETLADGVYLRARDVAGKIYFVQIVGGADHELHILKRGDSVIEGSPRTTVLFIDRYLKPSWIQNPFPPIHKPYLRTPVAILLGVVGGAIFIFCMISLSVYLYVAGKQQPYYYYHPSSPERQPLNRGSSSGESQTESYYGSVESPTQPIRTAGKNSQREFGRHLNLPRN